MSKLAVIIPVEPIGISEARVEPETETSLISFIMAHELSVKRIAEQFQQAKAKVLGDCDGD